MLPPSGEKAGVIPFTILTPLAGLGGDNLRLSADRDVERRGVWIERGQGSEHHGEDEPHHYAPHNAPRMDRAQSPCSYVSSHPVWFLG